MVTINMDFEIFAKLKYKNYGESELTEVEL